MGACVSSEDREGKERSARIDKLLEEDSRRLKTECKILLLGSGESGKSTVVKQMKIIHQNGFTRDELMIYRPVVNKNVVESAQDVANAIIKFSLQPEIGANRVSQGLDLTRWAFLNRTCMIDSIKDYMIQIKDFKYDPDPSFTLPPSLAEAIESSCRDPVIQMRMERSNQVY